MAYIEPELVAKAKEMDLLTYLKNYEPGQLVKLPGGEYCTRALLDTGKNSLSYVEALTIVNNVKRNICEVTATQYKSFLDALINENIFKACLFDKEPHEQAAYNSPNKSDCRSAPTASL